MTILLRLLRRYAAIPSHLRSARVAARLLAVTRTEAGSQFRSSARLERLVICSSPKFRRSQNPLLSQTELSAATSVLHHSNRKEENQAEYQSKFHIVSTVGT